MIFLLYRIFQDEKGLGRGHFASRLDVGRFGLQLRQMVQIPTETGGDQAQENPDEGTRPPIGPSPGTDRRKDWIELLDPGRVAAVGKNLRGSVASYSAGHVVTCHVVIGLLPAL